jgi:uncharacterized coiled-coil DUF342 family protein
VFLEDMHGDIKLIAEGQSGLRIEVKELRQELHQEVGDLRQEMHHEIGSLRQEMHHEVKGLRSEMNSQFKMLFQYLSRIEDELMEIKKDFKNFKETSVNKKDYDTLEKRITRIEEKLEKYQVMSLKGKAA